MAPPLITALREVGSNSRKAEFMPCVPLELPGEGSRQGGRASGAVYSLIQTTNQGVHGGECDPALRSEVNSLPRIRFLKKSRSRPRGSW